MLRPLFFIAATAIVLMWPADARAQSDAPDLNCKPLTFSWAKNRITKTVPDPSENRPATTTITGDVLISCNDWTIAADEIEYVEGDDWIVARGHVLFKQSGVTVSATLARLNRYTHLGTFSNVAGALRMSEQRAQGDLFGGLEPDAYFYGESLEKIGPKTYKLINGKLTTCTQATPRWFMTFSGTITPGKHVFMRNLVLSVKNVPLLYLPAFYYPITKEGRSTGFLMPGYGTASTTGFNLSNAFFWAINRSQDATFYHNYFSKTGMGYGADYEYIQAPGAFGNVLVSVVAQKAVTDTAGNVTQAGSNIYKVTGGINQALGHGLRVIGSANYMTSVIGEQTYQQNFFDLTNRQSTINGNLSGSHGRYRYSAAVNLTDTFTGATTSTRTGWGPLLDLTMAEKGIGSSPIRFGAHAQTEYLIRRDSPTDPTQNHSLWRTDVSPTISSPISKLSFLTATVSAAWRFTEWSESADPLDPNHTNLPEALSRELFVVRADMTGPSFYRFFNGSPTGYAERYKHFISPQVSFEWNSPFRDLGRVVQNDPSVDGLVGGAGRITYGVTNLLIAKRHSGAPGSGTYAQPQILRVTLTQTYSTDLLAASTTQVDATGLYTIPAASQFTPVYLDVRANPETWLSGTFQAQYDAHFHAFRSYGGGGTWIQNLVQINLNWNKRLFIPGLPGYDTVDSAVHSLGGGAAVTTRSKHLGGSYSFNYDVQHTSMVNQRIVVYYNSQCCGITLDFQSLSASLIDPSFRANRSFGISFSLAGLGSFANPFGSFGGGSSIR